jgi:hypothetical protein
VSTDRLLLGFYEPVKPLAVQLQPLDVSLANPDFKGAFGAATKGRADAFLTLTPAIVAFYRKEIVTLVAKSRLPAIYHSRGFVEDGGLMSYGEPSRVASLLLSFSELTTYLTLTYALQQNLLQERDAQNAVGC